MIIPWSFRGGPASASNWGVSVRSQRYMLAEGMETKFVQAPLSEQVSHPSERVAGFGRVSYLSFQYCIKWQFTRERLGQIKTVDAYDVFRTAKRGQTISRETAIANKETSGPGS